MSAIRFRRGLAWGGLLLAAIGVARAEAVRELLTNPGSGIAIRVATPLGYVPHYGFMPVRVSVENRSARDGVWTVAVSSGEATLFPGLASTKARLEVAAGATQETWIYAPLAVPGTVAALVLDPTVPREVPPAYSVAAPAPPAAPAAPVNAAAIAAALEAEATALLGPTQLLDIPWGVNESVSTQNGVVTFEQTGSALALVRPPAGSLPPRVIVNLHSALEPGQVVRTITYVSAATLAAANAAPTSRAEAYRKAVARQQLALWRYGFLRRNGVVQASQFSSFADRDGVVTTTVSETGPATLLAQPLPESLPPDTLVSLAPAPVLPGGVTRRYTVTTLEIGAATDYNTPGPYSAVLGGSGAGPILVEVAGPGLAAPVRTDLSALLDGSIQPMPPIVLPPAIKESLLERLALGNLRGTATVTVADPAKLPADWRLWGAQHALVLRQSDFAALDPERRTALRRWVALGGRLVLSSESDDPMVEHLGAGAIVPLSGEIGYLPPPLISRQLELSWPSASLPIGSALARDHASIEAFGAGERSDTRWLVYALVGFAVTAGPLNLLVFAPAGRRHRMLVTMPLIALVGAVVMGAGVVVRVGLGGEGVRSTVVALAPEEGGAAVFQDQVSRTGILLSHRFALPDDTTMAAVPLDAGGAQAGGGRLERQSGEASGDWFRSRSFQAYQLRRFVPAPGRVEVTALAADGTPTVASTLGTTLRDFVWVDDQDKVWTTALLESGKAATLAAAPDAPWPRVRPHASKSLGDIFARAAYREPGRWTARSGGNAFAPLPTLGSIRWQDDEIVFTGRAPAKAWSQPPPPPNP
jgi:hypothetical protein